MNKRVIALVFLAVAIVGVEGDLLACGNKFLIPGRGVRFQRAPSERQASALLIYAPSTSQLSRTLLKLKVDASIRKVGYRPTVVTTASELDQVVSGRRWDIVLVDMADARALNSRLGASDQAHVVAVSGKLSGVQVAQARVEFPRLLRSPSRNQDFLDALDDAGACAETDRAAAGKTSR